MSTKYAATMKPWLPALLTLALLGCPARHPKYESMDAAKAAAVAARDAARAARDAKDPEAALAAADTAADALAQAEALASVAPETSAAVADLRVAAREARQLAQETDERAR